MSFMISNMIGYSDAIMHYKRKKKEFQQVLLQSRQKNLLLTQQAMENDLITEIEQHPIDEQSQQTTQLLKAIEKCICAERNQISSLMPELKSHKTNIRQQARSLLQQSLFTSFNENLFLEESFLKSYFSLNNKQHFIFKLNFLGLGT